jgi:hypothetical protein
MHTDEYEISIAREINVCRKMATKTQKRLRQRQMRFGMECQQAMIEAGRGRLGIEERELLNWQEDLEALPLWEQRLKEYEEALAVMRISASRF